MKLVTKSKRHWQGRSFDVGQKKW